MVVGKLNFIATATQMWSLGGKFKGVVKLDETEMQVNAICND